VALLSATLTVVDDASDFHVRDGGLAHLEPVADLCVTGEVRIHIDRTFTLEELSRSLLVASVRDAHSAKLLSAPPNAIRTRPDRGDSPEIHSST
jgi:hypothetical protein